MFCVVWPPGDQRYEAAPAAASSVTLPPSQNVVGPLALTRTMTVTTVVSGAGALAEHPSRVTVTKFESEPPLIALTIDCVVSPPGDHRYEPPDGLAVSVTLGWHPAWRMVDPSAATVATRFDETGAHVESADIGVNAVPGQSFVAVTE